MPVASPGGRNSLYSVSPYRAFAVAKLHSQQPGEAGPGQRFQTFKNACKEETEKLYFIETYMAEPVGGARVVTNGNFALNRCLTFGDWYTDSPLDQERFMALGVKSVEQTLFTDENAYLVARDVEDPGFLASWHCLEEAGGRAYTHRKS